MGAKEYRSCTWLHKKAISHHIRAAVTVSHTTKLPQNRALFPSVMNTECAALRQQQRPCLLRMRCVDPSLTMLPELLWARCISTLFLVEDYTPDVLVLGMLIQYFSSGSWQRLDSTYSCNRITKHWFGSVLLIITHQHKWAFHLSSVPQERTVVCFDKMAWNLSKHLSNYVKSYWKNMFWNFVNKVSQDKATPKYVSEQRLPKSGPKGTHSSSSAHFYSFIPVHNSTKRTGQNKEPKSAFLFQKGRPLPNPAPRNTFQCFPSFQLLLFYKDVTQWWITKKAIHQTRYLFQNCFY